MMAVRCEEEKPSGIASLTVEVQELRGCKEELKTILLALRASYMNLAQQHSIRSIFLQPRSEIVVDN